MEISTTTVEVATIVEETRHVITLTNDDLRTIVAALRLTTQVDASGKHQVDGPWYRLYGYMFESGLATVDGVDYSDLRKHRDF